MSIDFQQLQAAYTADQTGTVATLLALSQSIGQFAAQLAGAVTQADMLTQLGTLQTEAGNAASAVSGTTAFGTTVSGAAASGTTTSGTAVSGATVLDGALTGTVSGAENTVLGAAVPGSALAGTVSGAADTVSGVAVSSTGSGATALAGVISGTADTVSGVVVSDITVSAGALSGTVSGTANTVSDAAVADITVSGAALAATVSEMVNTVSGATVSSTTTLSGTTGAILSAAGATIDSTWAEREPIAQTISASVSPPLSVETRGLLAASSTVPSATQTAIAQSEVPIIVRTSVLINPLIDSSNPAIAAAIAAYHMVDGIFDTAWPHDSGAPPEIDPNEIRAIAGIGRNKLDLTA